MGGLLKRFTKEEVGATAVAYGLVAAAISLAILTLVHSLAAPLRNVLVPSAVELAAGER